MICMLSAGLARLLIRRFSRHSCTHMCALNYAAAAGEASVWVSQSKEETPFCWCFTRRLMVRKASLSQSEWTHPIYDCISPPSWFGWRVGSYKWHLWWCSFRGPFHPYVPARKQLAQWPEADRLCGDTVQKRELRCGNKTGSKKLTQRASGLNHNVLSLVEKGWIKKLYETPIMEINGSNCLVDCIHDLCLRPCSTGLFSPSVHQHRIHIWHILIYKWKW